LSSTSSAARSPSASTSRARSSRLSVRRARSVSTVSCPPTAANTSASTACAVTGASSAMCTAPWVEATALASEVLPEPPAPVRV